LVFIGSPKGKRNVQDTFYATNQGRLNCGSHPGSIPSQKNHNSLQGFGFGKFQKWSLV